MKRKIRGAVYDTGTAKEIARWPSEVDGVEDHLYRTKSGKYFTCEIDLSFMPEPRIIVPRSRREAIWLACKALGSDTARAYFEDDEEGERTLSVKISTRVYNILRNVAAERNTSMAQLIEELVNEGESFGEDAATFDEIARHERIEEERMRNANEYAERTVQP